MQNNLLGHLNAANQNTYFQNTNWTKRNVLFKITYLEVQKEESL